MKLLIQIIDGFLGINRLFWKLIIKEKIYGRRRKNLR